MARPLFTSAWAAFMAVRLSVADVGRKIGGAVQKNTDMPVGGFRTPVRSA